MKPLRANDVKALSAQCMLADDVHGHIDQLIRNPAIKNSVKNAVCLELSKSFARNGDKLTAIHFANLPLQQSPAASDKQHLSAIQQLMKLGQHELALRHQIGRHLHALNSRNSDKKTKTALLNTFQAWTTARDESREHGHGVLMHYLATELPAYRQHTGRQKPVLVEIGSTRENIPNQGSRLKLAQFCLTQAIDFISVDMDPHNTQAAQACFQQLGAGHFQAVNAKGEDYLAQRTDTIDFAFLDAYDFDHGNHSALRQSRYTRYLGAPISDPLCHQMHLDCAKSIVPNMPAHGLICIDDTWLDNNQWTAKGTLAMPYLLANGFELIEARNRAALLRKKAPT